MLRVSRRLALLVAVVALSAPQFASAAGDAGCGLGHLAWQGKNGKLAQLLAVTTNGTFGSQTFGITTGTSGCTASGLVRVDREQEYFANVNRDVLSIEMARGEGENLAALAALMGCSDVRGFASFTQSRYVRLFPSAATSGAEMLRSLRTEMQADPFMATNCERGVASAAN